jgi:hypothetical protein
VPCGPVVREKVSHNSGCVPPQLGVPGGSGSAFGPINSLQGRGLRNLATDVINCTTVLAYHQ